jgi:hypothetical protein
MDVDCLPGGWPGVQSALGGRYQELSAGRLGSPVRCPDVYLKSLILKGFKSFA